MQELMGALQDVKVQQSIYESKFQRSQLDCDFTLSEDEASTESQQLAQLTAMKNSIRKIESKILKLKNLLEDLDLKLDNL